LNSKEKEMLSQISIKRLSLKLPLSKNIVKVNNKK
jgi:hypothetical protein